MTYNATADIRLVLAFAETGLVILIVIVIIIIRSFQYIAYMSSGPKHELWSQKEGGEIRYVGNQQVLSSWIALYPIFRPICGAQTQ